MAGGVRKVVGCVLWLVLFPFSFLHVTPTFRHKHQHTQMCACLLGLT